LKTRKTIKFLLPFVAALALCLTAFMANRTVRAFGFPGAIYTSKGDGTTVNANLFTLCADVYLNGGPQGMNSNGLPNGDYYFQVTNPSGSVLLSTDPAVCRQVTVSGGRISGAAQASVNAGCAHLNGTFNASNGTTPVQLFPFSPTPNNGGEYKVWLIPTGVATIGSDPKVLTFTDSKSDNFKCREFPGEPPQSAIGGTKYYDTNHNGTLDPGELGIEGITIKVTLGNGTMLTTETDEFGVWALVFPVNTVYTSACEVLPTNSTYTQTGPTPSCYSGTVGAVDISNLDFFNVICQPVITCPTNIENVPAGANCQANVSYLTPTSTDNCGNTVPVVCNPASGAAFALGTTTVTCKATGPNPNNTASCSFTVTVVDKTAPTLSLPIAVEACSTGGGLCSAVVNYTATAADNCDNPVAFACIPASGSTFALGVTAVNCTATDVAGNSTSGSFNVTVKDCSVGSVSGKKVYDANGPLAGNVGSQIVKGFKIVLSGTQSATTYTDASGNYSFGNLPPGSYTVTEFAPGTSWVATKATSFSFTVSCANPSNIFTYDFCNYCKTPSGGLTLGFWSNKNGQAATTPAMLCYLTSLSLRSANGSDFDPVSATACSAGLTTAQVTAGKTALNNWLLSANAVNMANMLSAQLAAMELNVLRGNVNGNAYTLCYPGTVNQLMAAARASLIANPNTTAAGAARTAQESLKNCLDALNNNGLLVSPVPCPFTSPY
jgi:HYR domain/SdrD B-like domain